MTPSSMVLRQVRSINVQLLAGIRRLHTSALRAAALQEKTVSVRGINFHVSIGGAAGGRPVLCIPGALGTAQTDFGPQLNGGLGTGFTVVSFDPRGYGKSRPPVRDYPVDFYHRDADDGKEIMLALGHKQFSLLGWSDGANAACLLAAKYPELVQKLVIWGGNSYITKKDIELWEKVRDINNWSEKMRSSLTPVYGDELQPMNHRFTDAMHALMNEKMGDVCLEYVHKITCPTLVIYPHLDQMVSDVHPKYFAHQIANAELVDFPEGKHNVHLRHADSFNAKVGDFLEDKNPAKEEYVDINNIAYGFMGSKTLFAALHANIFDIISKAGPQGATFSEIEAESPASGERLQTLLTGNVALKLLRCDSQGRYFNTIAAQKELVSSSKYYWGDYLKFQVDMQFYNRMVHLAKTMETGDAGEAYDAWFESDPEAAALYTQAQHNGSLATAYAMMKRVDLTSTKHFLDVGGGSGAFAIAVCRKVATAKATVLDLPNVVKKTAEIVATEPEEVSSRIGTKGLSATFGWGVDDGAYDVVNMSYISGSIPREAVPDLYAKAFAALAPGGRLIVHDFMVDNSRKGPKNSAFWGVAHISVNPLGAGLYPALVCGLMTDAGFKAPYVREMIGELTKVIVATKP